jgi:hypothetical protein
VKKDAIFKRAREETAQLSRETLDSVYAVLDYSGLCCLLMFHRQDARAMLEEIMAQTAQDSSMGDLTSMFSKRDVRDPG